MWPGRYVTGWTVSQQPSPATTLRVVIAGEQLQDWAGELSEDSAFWVVRCSDSVDEVVPRCRVLTPCVLIAGEEFVSKINPPMLTDLVDFGRLIQVLVAVEEPTLILCENLLRMGCMGMIIPTVSVATLRRAIRAVACGELWFGRKTLSALYLKLLGEDKFPQLTPREGEILNLIQSGSTNSEIGNQLCISHETVRWHIRGLYAKLGVHDRQSVSALLGARIAKR
jgi:DNA-binding NarL/FixJ family response regulator